MTAEEHAVANGPRSVRGPGWFETTNWTLVVRAADAHSDEGAAALEELCRTYWRPLYSYARNLGLPPPDAEDLTQGFFADILARDAIARADASRGRFRTFLITSFKNFHSRQRAAAGREKRGGGKPILSLDVLQDAESQFLAEPRTKDSPEESFDRRWASSLLAKALTAVRADYEHLGKAALFDELKAAIWGGGSRCGYASIGQRHGMSEGAVKVAIHRLRQKFGEQFQREVSNTVSNPADVEDEIRYLLTRVSG